MLGKCKTERVDKIATALHHKAKIFKLNTTAKKSTKNSKSFKSNSIKNLYSEGNTSMPTEKVEGLASLETSIRRDELPMPINTAKFLSANNSHSDHENFSGSESDTEDFINASKPHPRWCTPLEIGDFKIRSLIDNGAVRTYFGPVGLQLATTLGARVKTYSGPTVPNASEHIIPIGAQVRLPIKVANKKKYKSLMWPICLTIIVYWELIGIEYLMP